MKNQIYLLKRKIYHLYSNFLYDGNRVYVKARSLNWMLQENTNNNLKESLFLTQLHFLIPFWKHNQPLWGFPSPCIIPALQSFCSSLLYTFLLNLGSSIPSWRFPVSIRTYFTRVAPNKKRCITITNDSIQ